MRCVSTGNSTQDSNFGLFLDQNQGYLRRLVVRRLGFRGESRCGEDVLQAVNLMLCRQQRLFQGTTAQEFRSWARPFAGFTAANFLRAHRRYKARFGGVLPQCDSEPDWQRPEAPGQSVDSAMEREELEQILKDALQALRPRHALLLRLFFFDRVSLNELAARFQRTDEAMRKLLARSLKELRKMFYRRGWDDIRNGA